MDGSSLRFAAHGPRGASRPEPGARAADCAPVPPEQPAHLRARGRAPDARASSARGGSRAGAPRGHRQPAQHGVVRAARGGVLRARVHLMFLDAPASVQEALVRYIVRGDRAASQIVGQYIDANGHRIKAMRPVMRAL